MGNAVAALPPVIDVFDHGRPKSARLVPPGPPNPPLVPRHVHVTVPPSPTPPVVIVPVPRVIVPACAVHYSAIVFISPLITGSVAHLHFIVGRVIHSREGCVINRRTGRYSVNLVRYFCRYLPGAGRRGGGEPNRVVQCIVSSP